MTRRDLLYYDRSGQRRDPHPLEDYAELSLEEIKDDFETDLSILEFLLQDNRNSFSSRENQWRFVLAQTESCFDFYLHQFRKYGIIAMYRNNWPRTDRFRKFKISMENLEEYASRTDMDSVQWLLKAVSEQSHGECYLDFHTLCDQMNLIGIKAKEVFGKHYPQQDPLHRSAHSVLVKIYSRRNQIVHQSDRRHKDGSRLTIDMECAQQAIVDIKNMVDLLHAEALAKNLNGEVI